MKTSAKFAAKEHRHYKYLGLNLSSSLINCTYEELSSCFWDILNLYFSFSQHPYSRLRNLVAYGLGELLLKVPLELVSHENLLAWLDRLWQAYSAPYGADTEEDALQHSKENVVSAIGKFIFKCAPKFPHIFNKKMYASWLSELPLNSDQIEGDIQQGYLIGLLSSDPATVVQDRDDLKRVCEVYASFLKVRHNHENTAIIDLTK